MNVLVPHESHPTLSIYPPASVWTKESHRSYRVKVRYCLYAHPRGRKIAKIAAYAIGITMVAGASLLPLISDKIGLAIGGTLIIGITYLAARILNSLVPMSHDMKHLAFHPGRVEHEGILLGELYYDGLVPILKINTSDPREAGYVQGYLLQEAISSLRSNVEFVIFTLLRYQRPSKITDVLNTIKSHIPDRLQLEMKGIVEGYNKKKGRLEKSITFEDILYLQLMPDSLYFNADKFQSNQKMPKTIQEEKTQPPHAIACSLLALFDSEDAPLIARLMDWESFGVAGPFSLIISRYHAPTNTRTAEVGIPGMIGTLTGVSNKGLSIAMNVVNYIRYIDSIEGMPACLYNRVILEECASFGMAHQVISSHSPLGPYHLTVSDASTSAIFSFYQKKDWTGVWQEDKKNSYCLQFLEKDDSMIITNCSRTPTPVDMFKGKLREQMISEFLAYNHEVTDSSLLLETSQSIPDVNNHATTHRVLFGHKTLKVAFDNAWSGDRALHTVNLEKVFDEDFS